MSHKITALFLFALFSLTILSGCIEQDSATGRPLDRPFLSNICDDDRFEGECAWVVDGQVRCTPDDFPGGCRYDSDGKNKELVIQNAELTLEEDVRAAIEWWQAAISLRIENVTVRGGRLLSIDDYSVCEGCRVRITNVTLDGSRPDGTNSPGSPFTLHPPQFDPPDMDIEIRDVDISGYDGGLHLQTTESILVQRTTLQGVPIRFHHAESVTIQNVQVTDVQHDSGMEMGISLQGVHAVQMVDSTVLRSSIGIGVHLGPTTVEMENVTASDNIEVGLHVSDVRLDMVSSRFERNGHGSIEGNGRPGSGAILGVLSARIRDSIFEGNKDFGIFATIPDERLIDARENWWGHPDGPSVGVAYGGDEVVVAPQTAGDAVVPWMEYEPWLTVRPER